MGWLGGGGAQPRTSTSSSSAAAAAAVGVPRPDRKGAKVYTRNIFGDLRDADTAVITTIGERNSGKSLL